jgi:microcystin-dependent protein
MSNITGIDPPQNGDGRDLSYVSKLSDSLNAIDDHTHAAGAGLPVKRIDLGSTDDSTITAAAGVASVKDGSVTNDYATTGLSLPTGAIISHFDLNDASPGSEYLRCDGSQISRTTYATLYAVIGDKFGNGNGTTTFHLPNLTGMFVRGADLTAGRDPDASSRAAAASGGNSGDNIGSVQKGAMKTHTHTVSSSRTWRIGGPTPGATFGGAQNWGNQTPTYTVNNSGGNEFRPKNMAVAWWIRI